MRLLPQCDYRLYLKDILAAIESIEAFVEGMDFEAFRTDDKTASAVIRKFEIIARPDLSLVCPAKLSSTSP